MSDDNNVREVEFVYKTVDPEALSNEEFTQYVSTSCPEAFDRMGNSRYADVNIRENRIFWLKKIWSHYISLTDTAMPKDVASLGIPVLMAANTFLEWSEKNPVVQISQRDCQVNL